MVKNVNVEKLIDTLLRCMCNYPFGEFLKRSKILSVIITPAGLTIHFTMEKLHHISFWDNDGEFIKDNVLKKSIDFEAYIEAQEVLDNTLTEFSRA